MVAYWVDLKVEHLVASMVVSWAGQRVASMVVRLADSMVVHLVAYWADY